MKKLLLSLCLAFSTVFAFSFDFQVKAMPAVNIGTTGIFKPAFAGTAGIDILPFTLRQRDSLGFTLEGTYGILQPTADLKPFYFVNGSLGLSYNLRILDRLTIGFDAFGGIGVIPLPEEDEKIPEEYRIKDDTPFISYGARLNVDYHILPFLKVGAFVGYNGYYFGKNNPNFMDGVSVGLSLKYSFARAIGGKSVVQAAEYAADPLFPVFYSWYDENKFGTIHLINKEQNKLSNVTVSVFIEEFMSNEDVCATFDSIASGEDVVVDLTAFLNENILNTIMAHRTEGKVIVRYSNLGLRASYETPIELKTLSRNNMSWEEDERAAAFVSANDASAKRFARFVQIALKNNINSTESMNIQYARGVFASLKTFGINYVVDPASAFTDNSGTAAIDYLQFPYQTLLYRGGDCDDLSILNCALLEALGVETAFITVPGHIFMAFDSGYNENDVSKITDKCYIIQDDKVWIPVEITLCRDTFQDEKNTGMREWNKYPEERLLLPVHKAWEKYKPVGIADSDVDFELPDITEVVKNLK